MGILVEDNEERSKLQERIAADIRARQEASSLQEDHDYDIVDDSAMLEGTQKTARFSWFWVILIVLAIVALLVIFVIK